jgi:hypothetical protein
LVVADTRLALDATLWRLRIQGLDGPLWEGRVPRVAMQYGGREVGAVAGSMRFGDDADHDGIEEIGVDFDARAVRAMLGGAGPRETAEVTLVAEAGPGASWSAPFHLAIGPAPREFTAWLAPNPAHADGVLTFTLSKPGFARVDVYDTSGRRVRRLLDRDDLAPGMFRVALGERLPSGLFYYRIEAREGILRGRITILR